jgi:hypothetical protein
MLVTSLPLLPSQVESFFTCLIQRVAPKSTAQAAGEVKVTRAFFENFSGDQVGQAGVRGEMRRGDLVVNKPLG